VYTATKTIVFTTLGSNGTDYTIVPIPDREIYQINGQNDTSSILFKLLDKDGNELAQNTFKNGAATDENSILKLTLITDDS
jgi:hypothetical protein